MPAPLTRPEELAELLGIPFTPEQLACITAPAAPQAIVAGAGSGKTTVMAARVVWLTGTGQVAPERVLGLTFTNKAAGELAERVRKALGEAGITGGGSAATAMGGSTADGAPGSASGSAAGGDGGEPEISTYHAFAGRLLAEHGLRLGIEPASRLLADAGRFQLAAEVLRSAPASFDAPGHSFTSLVTDLVALDGELSEHLVTPEQLRAWDEALLAELEGARLTNKELRQIPEAARGRTRLLEVVEEYRARKRARDLLDFGDQVALAATLARDVPETGRALREEFGVVLLDEYQDTSVSQRILLSGLFGGGTGHPVTAVGDPCQAIYGWRGASVANLDDFPAHFPRRDGAAAPRYTLSENRRSGGRLLRIANGLAEPLRALHPAVEPLRPAGGAEEDGTVRCALLPTHAGELEWLADSVAHRVRTGTPPGEIAVLCRTAGDFAGIQQALVARDVPVEVVGLSGLLHLPEVADLVATCEVLADPTANAALVRLLSGPRWRIGPRDLALLGRLARLLVRRGGQAADAPGDRAADADRLAAAVEGTDPAETTSLADALDTFLSAAPGGGVPGGRGQDGGQDGTGGATGRESAEGYEDSERAEGPKAPGGTGGAGGAEGQAELPFSAEARLRFAHLAAEIRELRRSLADPLMDVLYRVLATTGLEVELSASPHAVAARRRETLSAFLDVAAGFAAGRTGLADGGGEQLGGSLPAFLAFLRAADRYDKGLDGSLPGGENTVKVLTAHKAKGLEWDVVALPGLVADGFPAKGSRDSWLRHARALPHPLRGDAATLPAIEEWTAAAHKEYTAAVAGHLALEERRLGYVAFTRPRSLLLGSGHWWGPSQKRPRGPSEFLDALRRHCEAAPGHGEVELWAAPPEEGEENPALASRAAERSWPLPLDPRALDRRREAAERVLELLRVPEETDGSGSGPGAPGASGAVGLPEVPEAPGGSETSGSSDIPDKCERGERSGKPVEPGESAEPGELTPEERRTVASWDRDLRALTGELRRAREGVRDVPLPGSLSASQVQRLASDPEGFARELARPMPRPPQPAARRGTRFHAWVESRFEELELPLLGPDELPGGDPGEDGTEIRDERELAALKEAFARTPFAGRTPHRVEAPFQLQLAGRVIRGRIDAVYRTPGPAGPHTDTYEIIDWKTGRRQDADPLQLALYRLAWAERHGLPLSAVTAAFLYVRSGELVRPSVLPGRRGLERLLLGEDSWEPNEPG